MLKLSLKKWIYALVFLTLFYGCSSTRLPVKKTQIVLLADPDGRVGTVEVSTEKGSRTLTHVWQSSESDGMQKEPGSVKMLSEKQVQELFREALDARPMVPLSFIVYFRTDSSILSSESLEIINQAMESIKLRPSVDVIISGHTDAVGSVDYNHRLSLYRANTVYDILISKGVEKNNIQVTYHGKGNPLIPTPDGVPEKRNRRVEITIR